MNQIFTLLGWCFLFIALLFLLGLVNPLARHFYPGESNVIRRAVAPVLFALLAIACFQGAGMQAMLFIVVAGMILIAINRRNQHRQRINHKVAAPVAIR